MIQVAQSSQRISPAALSRLCALFVHGKIRKPGGQSLTGGDSYLN